MLGCNTRDETQTQSVAAQPPVEPSSTPEPPSLLVEEGTEEQADVYYKEIAKELSTSDFEYDVANSTFDDFLKYGGWEGLQIKDVEALDSFLLMPTTQEEYEQLAAKVSNPEQFRKKLALSDFQDDKILVTRYFSPKIMDVSNLSSTVPGWRKIARLVPREGSPASKKGIDALYVLINIFNANLDQDPWTNKSNNNQAIMTVGGDVKKNERPLYFFVFKGIEGGYGIAKSLDASFDGARPRREHTEIPGNSVRPYFVPNACSECHGVFPRNSLIQAEAKVNYVDTDHLFDRVQEGDDFPQVGRSKHGVVFDGGKDLDSPEFKRAMDVLFTMNSEIMAQNERSGGKETFQYKAVKQWVDVHTETSPESKYRDRYRYRHVPLLERGIPGKERNWGAGDERFLGLLNRYCFRCHSSFRYNVFDKEGVFSVREEAVEYLNLGHIGTDNKQGMPQDRKLDKSDYEELKKLFNSME